MAVELNKVRHFTISRESDAAKATYVTRMIAQEAGFNTTRQTMIATAVSELATNILKYATRGYISIGIIRQMTHVGIEIIAEDQGPGISDRVKALSDHYSTGDSLGLGLPSVKRLMDEFIMDSDESVGTKIVVRKWNPIP